MLNGPAAQEAHFNLESRRNAASVHLFYPVDKDTNVEAFYCEMTGEKQRFIVTAKPTDAAHTIYSGYYFHPDKKQWVLISSWKAPKEGGYMRRLYSFSENFGGSNGHVLRKALYDNQWIRTDEGRWVELTTAGFSHDPTGKADRLDRFMGVESGKSSSHTAVLCPASQSTARSSHDRLRAKNHRISFCPSDLISDFIRPQAGGLVETELKSGKKAIFIFRTHWIEC